MRKTFLARACGQDAELRRSVQALLDADVATGNVLDTPACTPALESGAVRAVKSGQQIGAYTIVRLIGSGGMGNVYEAAQNQPRRTVALKLMRSSLASDQELRRFQYESELLGRLRHPNIAHVYEAGIHEHGPLGVPYFAMEYVADSRHILDYATVAALTVAQRIELFIAVCEAVQHGHQKGIVHCDLKPGNILVDRSGTPKVIDYGVARAVDIDMPMTTVRTSMGALIGTLQYMSPEQLTGNHDAVDTRSDVYALGLVLFELLAGRRPYDLVGKTLSDAIQSVEVLPCPRLDSVSSQCRGDMTTIVAKAMDKERGRRYQSPGEFAADLRRVLQHEPIEARPASALYRFRKFAARNTPLVATGTLGIVALATGLAVAGWQFRTATIERDRARVEARKSEHINDFLKNVLASADPRRSTAEVSIREALDRAAGTIELDLANEPQVRADVHATIGSIYVRLQLLDKAEHHLRAALAVRRELFGPRSCEAADTLSDLAWALNCDRRLEQEQLFREALLIYTELYGAKHPIVAANETFLASCMVYRGDHTAAEDVLRSSIASLEESVGLHDDKTAFALKTLAQSLDGQSRTGDAETAFRKALAVHREVYLPDDYELALMLSSTSRFMARRGLAEEAAALGAEADRIYQKRLGVDHSN
jgi:serine/threonine protein kinase